MMTTQDFIRSGIAFHWGTLSCCYMTPSPLTLSLSEPQVCLKVWGGKLIRFGSLLSCFRGACPPPRSIRRLGCLQDGAEGSGKWRPCILHI